jgi:hypothetical protein
MLEHWQHILSAITGGWLTAFMVKLVITRSIRNLDCITAKLEHVARSLDIVEAKLQGLESLKTVVFEHDRKLAAMEVRHRNNGKGFATPDSTQ